MTGLKFYPGDADDLRKKLVWFVEDFSRCDRFDFSQVPVVSIQDQAADMERRYLALVGNGRAPRDDGAPGRGRRNRRRRILC